MEKTQEKDVLATAPTAETPQGPQTHMNTDGTKLCSSTDSTTTQLQAYQNFLKPTIHCHKALTEKENNHIMLLGIFHIMMQHQSTVSLREKVQRKTWILRNSF